MVFQKLLLCLVCVCFILVSCSYSQNTKLIFRLIDCESEELLPNVSIYFTGEEISDYSFSDLNGIGELNLSVDDLTPKDSISFIHLNYKAKSIFPEKGIGYSISDTIDLCLDQYAFQLSEAIVSAKAKEKKIVYLPDELRRKEDRDLGDVLSNIPGLEVRNGEILYNGQPVSEVLLDGDDFVDVQRMSLLKAISVNRIDSILISKVGINHNELTQSSNVKLDIKTKDHLKKMPYVALDLKGGSAYSARNDVVFQPSSKVKSISGFGSNNIGINLFSYKDFILLPSHQVSATTPYQIEQQLSFVFNDNNSGDRKWNSHVFSSNTKIKFDSSTVGNIFFYGGLLNNQKESNINVIENSDILVDFNLNEKSSNKGETIGLKVEFKTEFSRNVENNTRVLYSYSSLSEAVLRSELEAENNLFSAKGNSVNLLLENTTTWFASKKISPFVHLELNKFSEHHISSLHYDSLDISDSILRGLVGRRVEWIDSRDRQVLGGFIGSKLTINRESSLTTAVYVGENEMRNENYFRNVTEGRKNKRLSQFSVGISSIYSLSFGSATTITSSVFLPFVRDDAFTEKPDFKVNMSINRKLGSVFKFLQLNGSVRRSPLLSSFYASRFDLSSPYITSNNSFLKIQSNISWNGSLMVHNLSPNGRFSRFWFLQAQSSPIFPNTIMSATNRLIELNIIPDNFARLSIRGGFVMSHTLSGNLGSNRLELDVAFSQIPSSTLPISSELVYEPRLRYKHTFDFTENMSGEVDLNSSFYFLLARDFLSGTSSLEYSMTFRQINPFIIKVSSEGYIFSNPELNLTQVFNSSSEISTQLGSSNQFEISVEGSLKGRNLGDILNANVSRSNLSTVEKFNSLPGYVLLGLKYNF